MENEKLVMISICRICSTLLAATFIPFKIGKQAKKKETGSVGFVVPSIILKVSRTLRLVFIPGLSEWRPLFSERWGTLICGPRPLVSSGALVSGSRAVAGGDSRGIDAFMSGSKVMSPAALSCVYDTRTSRHTHKAP